MNRKHDSFRTCKVPGCERRLPLNRHNFSYKGVRKDGSKIFHYQCLKCFRMIGKLKRMGEMGKEKLAKILEAA